MGFSRVASGLLPTDHLALCDSWYAQIRDQLPALQVACQTVREAMGSSRVASDAFQDVAACRVFQQELRATLKVESQGYQQSHSVARL